MLNDEQVLVKMDELVLMQKEFEQSTLRATTAAAKMHTQGSTANMDFMYKITKASSISTNLATDAHGGSISAGGGQPPTGESKHASGIAPPPGVSKDPVKPLVSPLNLTQREKDKVLLRELQEDNIDFEVTIYFPKKFEALRKFYTGNQFDFVMSVRRARDPRRFRRRRGGTA